MTAPIRPGTAARLGLRPPERLIPTGLLTAPQGFTDKELRELKAAAGVWFAKEGWRYSSVPPVAADWDARFRFPEPVEVEVRDPVTGELLGTVYADRSANVRQLTRQEAESEFAAYQPPRRRWWHRRNR